MQTIDEVHIAPLGFEHDRIVGPVRRHNVDVLYLLEHDDPGTGPAFPDDLRAELDDLPVDVRTRSVDVFDIYDVLGVVTTLTADHADDIVRVNVSSGSKLAAVGAAIACMATDATAYYVHPEEYPDGDRHRSSGYAGDEVLPSYPIESPTTDQVAVMDFLADANSDVRTVKKKDIIEYAEAEGLAFVTDNEPANDKAKFALLNANVVDPLLDDGYIAVEDVGRRKQVTLTDTGADALRAFRHKIRDR
ncbi:HFX_2341 family transcriptional regulator domain-containing protein [Halorussus sp. AFM4]|uniref:HFX_2341 family transcriptional regulator domain-containing protein n=1 Tax=Halorussus sp. AFM4 TaxID=3421651 RepID=UPI003EBEEE25